eukprot:1160207-Pelagomonas_calceolata.AAC.1
MQGDMHAFTHAERVVHACRHACIACSVSCVRISVGPGTPGGGWPSTSLLESSHRLDCFDDAVMMQLSELSHRLDCFDDAVSFGGGHGAPDADGCSAAVWLQRGPAHEA